jgi:hypothetical protein
MDQVLDQLVHLGVRQVGLGRSTADQASVIAAKLIVRFAVYWSPASNQPPLKSCPMSWPSLAGGAAPFHLLLGDSRPDCCAS